MTQLPAQTCTLTVVGSQSVDQGYVQRVQRLAQEQGLAEQVRWLGEVDEGQLQQAYASHHVLAMPSSHEGFGIVYLEGMGYGLPALASDSGGAAELVVPGKTGFLITPGRSDELAAHIHWLHDQRSELARMGELARRRRKATPHGRKASPQSAISCRKLIDTRRNPTHVA